MFSAHPTRVTVIIITWLLFSARPGLADCVTAWVLDPQSWTVTTGTTAPNFLRCGSLPACTQYNRDTTEYFDAQTCISSAANTTTTIDFSDTNNQIFKLRIQEFKATVDFCGFPENSDSGTITIQCEDTMENGGMVADITPVQTVFLNGSIPTSPTPINCTAGSGRYIKTISITFNGVGVTLFDPEICTEHGTYNDRVQLANYLKPAGQAIRGDFVGWLQCFAAGAFRCSFSRRSPTVFTRIPAMKEPESFFDVSENNNPGSFMLRLGSSNAFVYQGKDCDSTQNRVVMSIADFTQQDFRERASLMYVSQSPGQKDFWPIALDTSSGTAYMKCFSTSGSTAENCGKFGFAETEIFPPSELDGKFTLWQSFPPPNNGTNRNASRGVC